MSKFNKKNENLTTYEGAPATRKKLEDDWVNSLCSSFLCGKFYEDEQDQINRYADLTNQMISQRGPEFVAEAADFSRNYLGMRSVSALTAALLNNSQWNGKRDFYRSFFHRPDDVAEVFAAVEKYYMKRSHGLIKGAGDYLSSLSEYSLGKYKLSSKEYNMYDLINLTHAHSCAIDQYKNGTLPIPETWETLVSAAKSDEEKADCWAYLAENGKLGLMALIRNLRNLVKYCGDKDVEWWDKYVCAKLDGAKASVRTAISNSLVFPYRFYVAFKEFNRAYLYKEKDFIYYNVRAALENAFLFSIEGVEGFGGKSLIVLDVSGSMDSPISENSTVSIKEAGACYAEILKRAYGNKVDIIKFGATAKLYSSCTNQGVFAEIEDIADEDGCGYSTYIDTVWPLVAGVKYDRVFIISDMQVMDSSNIYSSMTWWQKEKTDTMTFTEWCTVNKHTPKVYSFDLGNYSREPSQFGGNINYFTALSPEVLKFIDILESGKTICDYIDSCEWKRW